MKMIFGRESTASAICNELHVGNREGLLRGSQRGRNIDYGGLWGLGLMVKGVGDSLAWPVLWYEDAGRTWGDCSEDGSDVSGISGRRGEWRGSELEHSLSRDPRTLMVHDPCPQRLIQGCNTRLSGVYMVGLPDGRYGTSTPAPDSKVDAGAVHPTGRPHLPGLPDRHGRRVITLVLHLRLILILTQIASW